MDDPLADDINELLTEDEQQLESDERREAIKQKLDYEKFKPEKPPKPPENPEFHNPAIQGYRDSGLNWSEHGWEPLDRTSAISTYQEYIPTDEAIRTLLNYNPLVEVGAGRGYISYIVNQNGGDCIPTDIHPKPIKEEPPVEDNYEELDYSETIWVDVQQQDAIEAVTEHDDRTVVMCHPSGDTRWAEETLDAISDTQKFIFIGSWFPGMDATPMFFKKLANNWKLLETFPLHNWKNATAHGYVFEKE